MTSETDTSVEQKLVEYIDRHRWSTHDAMFLKAGMVMLAREIDQIKEAQRVGSISAPPADTGSGPSPTPSDSGDTGSGRTLTSAERAVVGRALRRSSNPVPTEITEAMIEAGCKAWDEWCDTAVEGHDKDSRRGVVMIYNAMEAAR